MDVSCPQCETLYELDGDQLDPDGATLKCSQCGHLFRLELDSGVQSERSRRWMVRDAATGEFLYFTGFDTLHEWIMEGRVGEEDAISRTGDNWKRLGDIGEFAPIFQVVASIADLSESSSSQPSGEGTGRTTGSSRPTGPEDTGGAGEADADDSSGRARSTTNQQFGASDRSPPMEAPSGHSSGPKPRPESPSSPEPPPESSSLSDESTPADGGEDRSDSGDSTGQDRPETRFEDPRFRDEADGGLDSDAEAGDWTLGELEHEGPSTGGPTTDEFAAAVQPRRWPLVVAVVTVIVAGAAVGYWQREELGELAEDTFGDAEPDDQPTADTEDDITEQEVEFTVDELPPVVTEAVAKADAVALRAVADSKVSTSFSEAKEAARQAGEQADEPAAGGPSTTEELIAAGNRSLRRGEGQQAIDRFERALEESPGNARAVVGLGWGLLAEDSTGEAVEQFQRARRLDPQLGDALIGLGRAERNRGRDRQALEAYEEYLAEFPDGDQRSIAEHQSDRLRDRLGE